MEDRVSNYAVEILRDEWGVPHILGVTDADAAFGLARFKPSGWCRVVVGDAHGLKAWSNPIWLDDL